MILPNRNILLKPYIFLCCLFSVWGVFGMFKSKINNDINNEKITYYVALVGDAGVGKTQIINMFVENKFDEEYEATIGATNPQMEFRVNNRNINLVICHLPELENNKKIVLYFSTIFFIPPLPELIMILL